jgi:hypothetical protein
LGARAGMQYHGRLRLLPDSSLSFAELSAHCNYGSAVPLLLTPILDTRAWLEYIK